MRMIAGLMTLLMKIPAFRKRFYTKEMKPGMIRPLQKIVAQA
jgi:phenylacetate-coenzyme A ligase PaaK-like adenylate-forming protein